MNVPPGLGERGSKLFQALSTDGSDVARDALSLEAARITDRLDELDRIIAGDGVLELMRFRLKDLFSDGDDRNISVEVKFDGVLSEARQQANVLRQALVTLGLDKIEESGRPEQRSSILDELAKRRSDRTARA